MMDFKMVMNPSRWCLPAFIYALFVGLMILAIVLLPRKQKDGSEITGREKAMAIAAQLAIGFVVFYIMLLLCKHDMEMASWAMLVIPPLVAFLQRK